MFGKTIDEGEIDILKKSDDNYIKKKIHDTFKKKKDSRINILGNKQNEEIEKRIFLQIIDQNWKNHIQYLEQLRQVIGLRSYGNRDPLVEYKKEAFNLFEKLLDKLKSDLITILINLNVIQQTAKNPSNEKKKEIDPSKVGTKMGRNEPCFCGSNKKYKHCCGSL